MDTATAEEGFDASDFLSSLRKSTRSKTQTGNQSLAKSPINGDLSVTIDLHHLALINTNEFDGMNPKKPFPQQGTRKVSVVGKSENTDSNVNESNINEPEEVSDYYDEVFESAIGMQARDNVQLLLNALYSLEKRTVENSVIATLPATLKPKIILPRSMPLPEEKPTTRWETFANEKGIKKHKRSRMVFDEETGEERPRWGYKSAKNASLTDWAIPVKSNADPNEDAHAARRAAKKQRIEKNLGQHRRNLGIPKVIPQSPNKGKKTKTPFDSVESDKNTASFLAGGRRKDVERELLRTKKATASAGNFDPAIKGDVRSSRGRRQFQPIVGDSAVERESARQIAARVLKKEPVVDANRAANVDQQMREQRKRERRSGVRDYNDEPYEKRDEAGEDFTKKRKMVTGKRSKQGRPMAMRQTPYQKKNANKILKATSKSSKMSGSKKTAGKSKKGGTSNGKKKSGVKRRK